MIFSACPERPGAAESGNRLGPTRGGLAVRSPTEWGCTVGPVGTANSLVRRVNYQKGKRPKAERRLGYHKETKTVAEGRSGHLGPEGT